MGVLLSLGLTTAIFAYYYKDPDPAGHSTAPTGLTTYGIALLPLSLPLLIFAEPISKLVLGDGSHAYLFQWIVIASILFNFNGFSLAIFRAQRRPGQYIIITITTTAMTLGGTVYLVAALHQDVTGVILARLVAAAAGTVAAMWLTWRAFVGHVRWDTCRRMLRFGLPLVPTTLIGMIITMSDRFFLKHYATLADVGVYGLGWRLASIVSFLLVQPMDIALPPAIYAAEGQDYARDFYKHVPTYALFAAAMLWLGIAMLSPEIVRIMATADYSGAVRIIPLVCLGLALSALQGPMSQGLSLARRSEFFLLAAAVGAAVSAGGNLVLVPRYGATGAALSSVAAWIAVIAARYVTSRAIYPLPVEWLRFAKIVATAGGLYAVAWCIPSSPLWLALALKVVLWAAFPFALWALRLYHPHELSQMALIVAKARGRAVSDTSDVHPPEP